MHQAGIGAKELCRQHGISDGSFYKWRSKYGGMEVTDDGEEYLILRFSDVYAQVI